MLPEEIPGVRKFIFPYGYCLLMDPQRSYKFQELKTQTRIRIVLVDPYSANSVLLKEIVAVHVGPINQDVFKDKFVIYDQV